MPRSSRHKSHKQSKHSSKDYSDSDEDAVKVKDKSSKDDVSIRAYRDSASGEKRKISSEVPESKGTKDLSGVGNGEILEEYASSKRRKERIDVDAGGDRWSGGGDDRGNGDRNVEKENHKGDSMKVGTKLKVKGENLKIDLKNKSKRHESGPDERKEDGLTEQEESKSRVESKRRSERDSSSRKELKDKDHWSEKEKNGAQEKKNSDAGLKIVDKNDGSKAVQIGDIGEERQGKRIRQNTEQALHDELRNDELEKEAEKKVRRKREGSSERGKHYEDCKEGDERRLSSRVDRAKDLKYKDDKHKDGSYEDKYQEDSHKDEKRKDDKYQEDSHKDERRRDNKYREEADRDYKCSDDKHRDGEKNTRRRGDRHREDGDRDGRRRDEKHREDGERDSRWKDDKYLEGIERGRRDDKYHEDGDRDRRRKDARHYEDGDKDYRRGDERYRDSGERDDRRRDSSYRDDGNRDYRHKEEKFREDIEKDIRHKDSKQGDGHEKEKRSRDPKYRDEWMSRDRSGSKSDSKHAKDDDYTDHHTRKSSAYDDSLAHDDRTAKYRRNNEKEDYGDNKSRGTKDQRLDAEKISSSSARIDLTTDRGRSGSSKAADIELTSGHSRRWSSPTSGAHVPRVNYGSLKEDESKHGDDNYEEKDQHAGPLGGSEKTSYQHLEKLNKKDDGYLGELSAERRVKSDIGWSPSQPGDKSPPPSIGKRQFSRVDARRGIDFEESTQRSGGSREWKEYSGKEGRGSRDGGMDVVPGEEPLQADVDTVSASSPFMRNNHFSSNSKSLAPPPSFRAGAGSPSLLGLAEDDARGKSNIRHRRTGDTNVGRIQGSAWGGVPGWPSPVANGFLPFPSHVSFPSVMQPFTAPPMYGVRRSMEFDHPAPYHISDSDRFSGHVRPMGWGHQIDNSGHPLHSWDARNTVFGDDSHVYGRSDWDHTGNVPGVQIGDTSADLWVGQNRTGSMEISYSEKENDATRSGETLGNKSSQLVLNELNGGEQLGEALELDQLTKSSAKNLEEARLISMDDASDGAKSSKNDDVRLFHVYLSKLDLSADLTEPELLNECTGLIDMNTGLSSDKDDYSILYMGEMSSRSLLSDACCASADDSIFLKSMSLYKKQKEKFLAQDGGELKLSSEFVESSNQDNQNIAGDKTELVCPEDTLPEQPENAVQGAEIVEEAISAKDDDDMELKAGCAVGQQGQSVETPPSAVGAEEPDTSSAFEEKYMIMETPPSAMGAEEPDAPTAFEEKYMLMEAPPSSMGAEEPDASSASEVKDVLMESADACNNEEVKLLDSKCVPMVNSDVPPEAIMPESVLSGFVNSSRIHHSPESTH